VRTGDPFDKQYIFVGRLNAQRKFEATGLGSMYRLGTDIAFSNAMIDTLKAGDAERALNGLRQRADSIRFEARALAVMFEHCAAIALEPSVARYVLTLGGVTLKEQLTAEQTVQCEQRLKALIADYSAKLAIAGSEIKAKTIYRERMTERMNRYAFCDIPIWLDQRDHKGSRIINDVWLPAIYATEEMQRLQAQAMSNTV
jgi:hypothetical protein